LALVQTNHPIPLKVLHPHWPIDEHRALASSWKMPSSLSSGPADATIRDPSGPPGPPPTHDIFAHNGCNILLRALHNIEAIYIGEDAKRFAKQVQVMSKEL